MLPIWSTIAFWILVKLLHLRSMLSKSVRCTKNCNACNWHWSTEWAQFSSTAYCTMNVSKVERTGLRSFASSAIFTWPLMNQLLLLQVSGQLFFQTKHFHNQQEAENTLQEFVESRNTIFYTTGINLLLVGKNVLIVTIPLLINKDVFEPSYDDLKFTVQNCSYFFTNLIKQGRVQCQSLTDQWLRLCTATIGSTGSIPSQGTKILLVTGKAKKQIKK